MSKLNSIFFKDNDDVSTGYKNTSGWFRKFKIVITFQI